MSNATALNNQVDCPGQKRKLFLGYVRIVHLSNYALGNFFDGIEPIRVLVIKIVKLACSQIAFKRVQVFFKPQIIRGRHLMNCSVRLKTCELLNNANYSHQGSSIGINSGKVFDQTIDHITTHGQLKCGQNHIYTPVKPCMQKVIPIAKFDSPTEIGFGQGSTHNFLIPIFWLGQGSARFSAPAPSHSGLELLQLAAHLVFAVELLLVAAFHLRFSWSFSCNWLKLKLLRAQLQFKHEKDHPYNRFVIYSGVAK